MGLLLGALALPLGGTGGHSHAPGSALAGTGHPVAYVVRPGDTLWTIAERVDPTGDPRPLVAQLAAQVGSDTDHPRRAAHSALRSHGEPEARRGQR